jgi:rhodanese-related sulfurtransferase
MKQFQKTLILAAAIFFLVYGFAYANIFQYSVKHTHNGGDVTPSEAYSMVQKDPARTFLIDVRTRAEYEYIGHPVGAYNLPNKFMTSTVGEKGYNKVKNENFGKDLLSQFNPKTDTLIFLCRSGSRSCAAADVAVQAGWPADKVFNMMGGFEGDKFKNGDSAYNGKRIGGSWRNEGLPWTYGMDTKLVYQPDLAAH